MGKSMTGMHDNKQLQVSKASAQDKGYGQKGSSAAAVCLCKHKSQGPS